MYHVIHVPVPVSVSVKEEEEEEEEEPVYAIPVYVQEYRMEDNILQHDFSGINIDLYGTCTLDQDILALAAEFSSYVVK